MNGLRVVALAGIVLAWPHLSSAQQSVDYASVSGRVMDASGGVVPGAQVAARHTQTNVAATAVTDGDGRFRFPYLRIGPYEIAVHLDGFRDVTQRLELTAGSAFELPLTLSISASWRSRASRSCSSVWMLTSRQLRIWMMARL